MSKARSTTRQKLQIAALLDEHLFRENTFNYYAEGWSDERVAREVATVDNPITQLSVAGIRRELYGNFKFPPAAKPPTLKGEMLDRIEALEALELDGRVLNLHDRVVALEKVVNDIITQRFPIRRA